MGNDEMVFGPFQVGALRVLIAGLFLLPIALKSLKNLKGKSWLLLVVGVCGNFIPASMFTLAETNIDSSLAGLLNMSTSFFTVFIGMLFFKAMPTKIQLIGLVLGSVGLYFILSTQFDVAETKDIRYAFFIFPATLGYAISLTTIKFKLADIPSTAITSLSFMLILVPALIMCFITDAFTPIFSDPNGLKGLGYLSILSIIGTAVAVLLFTKLIAISNHIFSSAIAYMLPVVAIFIGLLDGEKFPWINVLYVGLILVGVFMMNKKVKPQQNKVSEE